MNKYQCIKLMTINGDSTITMRGEPDIVCTTDFSTPYIKKKRFIKLPRDKNSLLVFSWTDDSFRTLNIENIKNIKPLSETLGNKSYGEEEESWKLI